MSINTIEIINPGPLTTVQDIGRIGYLSYGIGKTGVMDQDAYKTANMLVENKNNEAVLEATLLGPSILFHETTIFAITGADMNPMLDNQPVSMYETLKAQKGQTLTLQFAQNGCRTYIAFAGGIDVPVVMGSRSTNLKCNIGGHEGRALAPGDILPIGKKENLEKIKITKATPQTYPSIKKIRVILGPQDDYFTEEGLNTFLTATYTVSPASDRMGYRLEGEAIASINGTDIVSDGITFGSIQIPPNGKPIILMADRQTTGGYAKIATVYSEDLPLIAQSKVGEKIQFEKITMEEIFPKKNFFQRLFGR